MTSGQRLLAVLRGQQPDRMPWAPFLTYWWDNNAAGQIECLGELGFKRDAGCDLLMRGHYDRKTRLDYKDLFVLKHEYQSTVVSENIEGNYKHLTYTTPLGSLTAGYAYSGAGDTWFLQEHPVKSKSDFRILRYIAEDSRISPEASGFTAAQSNDPDALFVPLLSPFTKSAFQSMIEFWVGTEEMAYALADYPEDVENALQAMQEVSSAAARICADSPAEAFMTWEDTSTTNISPSWYENYILPEINHWCDILHEKGKMYIQHACGHLRALAELIANSKIDALESVSELPTGNISPMELKELLPSRITIIGGIEPTFFANSTESELEKHIELLYKHFQGKRFILANADSCPPSVDVYKFGLVTARLAELTGQIPL